MYKSSFPLTAYTCFCATALPYSFVKMKLTLLRPEKIDLAVWCHACDQSSIGRLIAAFFYLLLNFVSIRMWRHDTRGQTPYIFLNFVWNTIHFNNMRCAVSDAKPSNSKSWRVTSCFDWNFIRWSSFQTRPSFSYEWMVLTFHW